MNEEQTQTQTLTKTKSQYDAAIAGCRDIFAKKFQDYGASWAIFRMPSITDQLYIKAERIKNLEENKISLVDEGILPEFQGIVNYCVIALLLLEVHEKFEGDFPDEWLDAEECLKVYDEKISTAYNLMSRKNHDYGEAWRSMRVSSFTDLILAKLLRLKQIEDNEGETIISEGPDANYLDILNYSVFALIKLAESPK